MNPLTDTITPRHTGLLRVNGVGRVGSYEAAARAHRSRGRRHWVIEEELAAVKITHGETDGRKWEARTKQQVREDCGTFKTKTLAIKFLLDYARANNLVVEGDIYGYPWLQLPAQVIEDFVNAEDEARRAEVIDEHKSA